MQRGYACARESPDLPLRQAQDRPFDGLRTGVREPVGPASVPIRLSTYSGGRLAGSISPAGLGGGGFVRRSASRHIWRGVLGGNGVITGILLPQNADALGDSFACRKG